MENTKNASPTPARPCQQCAGSGVVALGHGQEMRAFPCPRCFDESAFVSDDEEIRQLERYLDSGGPDPDKAVIARLFEARKRRKA